MGGELGPGVFEVEQSIDEFDDYRFITGVLSVYYDCDLDFGKIDEYSFIYCRKSQELFDTIMLAENAADYGMKMTIYCGLLEHLSESGKKEKEVVDMIDCLINSVNQTTTLTKVQKDSLRSYLKNGKEISPRQKCKRICKKYAKESYHGVLTNSIIDNAYNNRSAFAHGDDIDYNKITYAQLLKLVVLDVVEQYMINLQNIKTTSQ